MINKPTGLPFMIVCSAACGVILAWASYPYWYWPEMFLFAIPVGGLLFTYGVIRTGLADRKGNLGGIGPGSRWLWPCFLPLVVAIALITDAPFWVRFTISAPSLKAYAEVVAADPDREIPCQWVGLYYVCDGSNYSDLDANAVPGSAWFVVEDWFLHDNKGFLWLPSGEPEETADDSFRHLIGRWYGFEGWDHW